MGLAEFKLAARGRVRPLVLALDRLGMTPLMVSLLGLLITDVLYAVFDPRVRLR